ncbi:MAG: transglutaminase domain-containing protein, partial [Proteobacteria bacterium]
AQFVPSTPGIEENKLQDGQNSVDHFLFESKKGHCELYATSAAVLLRLGGVPTRLITGFRVSRHGHDDVVSVRMGDAHAWIEAYDSNRGWVPLDFTPRILNDPSVSEWFRDQYDLLSARWYEYVLSYGERTPTMTEIVREKYDGLKLRALVRFSKQMDRSSLELLSFLFVFGVASIIASFVALRFYRVSKRARLYGSANPKLVRERKRFEKWCEKHPSQAQSELARIWMREYESVRFGVSSPEETLLQIEKLKTDRQAIERSA